MPAPAQHYPQVRAVGSTFVPLDSWVYPALGRLAALGYAPTLLNGMKPWTRIECARLTDEAGEALAQALREDRRPDRQAVELHATLEREFAYELEVLGGVRARAFRLESIYARVTSISGPPLTDGFHFGQTISYDFGRPFRRGSNAVAGSAWRASAGPLAFYLRAEFQHAPSAPALSDTTRNLIATVDGKPLTPAQRFDPVHRARLLDTYASLNLKNWQLSFGKQSLAWGPGPGGALLFSNNAEPITMLRLTRVVPFEMPSFLRYLGPVRLDQFIGRVGGRTFVPRPFLYGQKITIKPSPYLEIGFARTVTLGGRGGDPFNSRNFFKTLFGIQGNPLGPGVPGDSRSAVDWIFRIPGLRNYVVLYADLFADDDELPYSNPPRATLRPGLHLTRIPGVPKLDFTIEAASSESPGLPDNWHGFNYSNHMYRDGYTNNGFLLGNTVGREGRAIQAWSTLWFSPRNLLQLSFKNNSVSPNFIPGGGYWQDYNVRHEMYLRSGFYVKSALQYEHIRSFPALFNGRVNNFTASVEFGFAPTQPKP
ncbi:MAG: capsule assembly Wzi family protein [Acidobacteria bacterium]|nr:capsule assembly Wzi family protein [Acidobacteriota bacterium]